MESYLYLADPGKYPDQGSMAVAPPVFTAQTRMADKVVRREVGQTFRVSTVDHCIRP